jgi:hypothetical protein
MSDNPEWSQLDLTWMTGTSTYVLGVIGDAAYFDGQSAISIGTQRSSCFWFPNYCPNGLTFSFWVKLTSYSTPGDTQYIISNGGHTYRSYGIALALVGDQISAAVRTTTKMYGVKHSVSSLLTNTWVHMVITWSTQQGIKVSHAVLILHF